MSTTSKYFEIFPHGKFKLFRTKIIDYILAALNLCYPSFLLIISFSGGLTLWFLCRNLMRSWSDLRCLRWRNVNVRIVTLRRHEMRNVAAIIMRLIYDKAAATPDPSDVTAILRERISASTIRQAGARRKDLLRRQDDPFSQTFIPSTNFPTSRGSSQVTDLL